MFCWLCLGRLMFKPIRLRFLLIGAGLGVMLSACNFAVQEATPEPTITPVPSATATASVTPTASPTLSPTPDVTATPAATATMTLTPSVVPSPSATPFPTVVFANDQWQSVDVSSDIRNGLNSPWFAFLLVNERTDTENLLTPVPSSELQTLYLINPGTGQREAILDLPASTDKRVWWAPDGNKVVYFREPVLLGDGTRMGGLYLLNLSVGLSLRLFDITSLSPRGLADHHPVWSPDSSQVAITLPTDYDVDIYAISADGATVQNLTAHGAYDLWPAWSPDGRRLAFVSDRQNCPTWTPGEPGSCSSLDATPPSQGHLYVLDVQSGDVQQVSSDFILDGPPTWVSNLQIAFTTGLSDPFAEQSHIWIANFQSGSVREITGDDSGLNLGAAWSPGGLQVLYQYQYASNPSSLHLRDSNGNLINSLDEYSFPRYGFAADWSPGGEWIAFAGRNGQCPYGLIVTRSDLSIFSGPSTMPRACDPSFSPDGLWLAYAGIQFQPGVDDGRLDLYIASANGYGAQNFTSRLRGQIRLLGWVGPAS